jgi:hypothetical protein
MKSNAKCWMPPAAALLIVMLLLNGCAMADSDIRTPCPPIVDYTITDQISTADVVEKLPGDAMIVRMLSDYAVLRDQVRTCG